MSDHVLNLFRIENLDAVAVPYRVFEVDIPCLSGTADDDHPHELLNVLATQIAYGNHVPVAILRRNGVPFVAVPGEAKLSRLDYNLTPEVAALRPRDDVFTARVHGGDAEARSVALAFVGFHLRSPAWRSPELWSAGASTYYSKRPLNFRENGRDVDIYEGFTFRIVEVEEAVYLAVDLKHRYVESGWLLEGRRAEDRAKLRMRHVLYHFGNQWYRAQLLDVLGRSIKETKFTMPDGSGTTNVFDYTLAKCGAGGAPWVVSLDPRSAAVAYQKPGSKLKRYGAAALCKLLLPTSDCSVSRLHSRSVRSPQTRMDRVAEIVRRYFQEVSMGGMLVRIARTPLSEEGRRFHFPRLRFGQNRVVRFGSPSNNGAIPARDLGQARMGNLLDPRGGFAVTSPLARQYLVMPEGLPRAIGEDFKSRLLKTTREFLHRSYDAKLVLYEDRDRRTLKAQVDAIVKALDDAGVDGARGVLMLPEEAKPELHNYVKRATKERFQFQCVAAAKLRSHYIAALRHGNTHGGWRVSPEAERNYVSYLRYASLGLLLVNRQWPFVLEDATNYDAYIGLDVLNHTAAFTFFYQGGRLCHVQACESKRREKLTREQVRHMVYKHLKEDVRRLERPPRSLILRRDGRSYECEWRGLRDAVEQLKREGILPGDVLVGVVDVAKSTASSVRLVTKSPDGLRNPNIGAWRAFSECEGIVCTTGWPARLRGTVHPLHVRVAFGTLDIVKILEDTSAMSLLCWSAPDRCMRLPVDLKLCDEYLRAVASDADEEGAVFGKSEENTMVAAAVAG